jgi:hypothetical protein
LQATNGDHLRFVPGELARAMVAAGAAEVHNSNGKVKSIRLVACASSHARLIGPPSDGWHSPPFVTREKLDGGGIAWRHHRHAWITKTEPPLSDSAGVSSTPCCVLRSPVVV